MLSHYELLEPLGEGGMGMVYRAVDTRLGRPVAVKVLRGDAAFNDESRKRFVQEARAASGLNHPHIVTIYDIGQDEGVDFIAMEYVARSIVGPSDWTSRHQARGHVASRHPDRRCAGRGPCRRHRPSRPQAGQHHGQRQRGGEGPRLRACEADKARRCRAFDDLASTETQVAQSR